MGDNETLGLHRLEDSSSVLFLVPAAGMVSLNVALGPMRIALPDHKERLLGLDGCYAAQLAQCRTELKAQLDREADREKAEAERAARRAKRLAKQQAAKKLNAQKKKKERKEREAGKENRGFARGFLAPAKQTARKPAASSPVASPVASPEPKPLRAADSNVVPPPTWQQQQIQQQKKRRLQRQREPEQGQEQQQQRQQQQQQQAPHGGQREMTSVEFAAIFLREAYRRRMPGNEVGAFLTSRGLTQAEQLAAFKLASSAEEANGDGQSAEPSALARISTRLENEL